MKIKQLLLAGLLIGSTIKPDLCEQINWNEWQDSSYEKDAAEEFAESFSSGVPALDDLEINKLAEYAEKYWMDKVDQFSDLSACKLTDQEMIIVQRFIGKGAGLALRIGMTLTQLEDRLDDEGLLVKEMNKLIFNIVSNDPEFTRFVINPICYLSQQADAWMAKQGPEWLDEDDFVEDLFGYVPRVKDACTALIEYNQWGREYLKPQNEHNGLVAIQDLCFVAKQLANYLEFPEKSKEVWIGLMDAIALGAQELHQDVHTEVNGAAQSWLSDDAFDRFMSDIMYANNMRKDLAANAQATGKLTQQDLDLYGSALDAVLEHGSLFEGSVAHLVKNVQSKLPLFEKLVFKN